ncbi:MAG: hypothetical protein ACYC0T_13450 [Ramlibacter sp.]
MVKSWKALGVGDMPEFKASTRASLDGQTPAGTTYQQWLERQSAERQDDILGPTRGRLLRQGKLAASDMWDGKGNYLTLAQMARRHRAAFERAGL